MGYHLKSEDILERDGGIQHSYTVLLATESISCTCLLILVT